MTRPSTRITCLITVTATAAAAVFATGGAAQSPPSTLVFKSKNFHFGTIDTPPRTLRKGVVTIGDLALISADLYRDGKRVGTINIESTHTAPAAAKNYSFTGIAQVAYHTPTGDLFGEAYTSAAKVTHGIIIGGTGEFAGKHGQISATAEDVDTITFDQ